jgi:hypothetical protein
LVNSTILDNQGLVGYWKFDVGSGFATTGDSSENGNIGTLINMNITGNSTSGWTSLGYSSNGLKFQNSVDYVNASKPLINDTVTISFWYYAGNGSLAFNMPNNNGFFYKNRHISFERQAMANVEIYFYNMTHGLRFYPTVNWSTGWHFALVSAKDVNGVVQLNFTNDRTTNTLTPNYYAGAGRLLTSDLLLGFNLAGGKSYNGTLDEFMVYNRSLTTNEIYQKYLSGRHVYNKTVFNLTQGQYLWRQFMTLPNGSQYSTDQFTYDVVTTTTTSTSSTTTVTPTTSTSSTTTISSFSNLNRWFYNPFTDELDYYQSCWINGNTSVLNVSDTCSLTVKNGIIIDFGGC